MGDGIDEAVVLFVAANFAHQENGVQDHPGDDGEENDAQKTRTPSRQLRMIQPTFSPTASSTRQTPSTTKKAMALRRLVMRMAGFYRVEERSVGRTLSSAAFEVGDLGVRMA